MLDRTLGLFGLGEARRRGRGCRRCLTHGVAEIPTQPPSGFFIPFRSALSPTNQDLAFFFSLLVSVEGRPRISCSDGDNFSPHLQYPCSGEFLPSVGVR